MGGAEIYRLRRLFRPQSCEIATVDGLSQRKKPGFAARLFVFRGWRL